MSGPVPKREKFANLGFQRSLLPVPFCAEYRRQPALRSIRVMPGGKCVVFRHWPDLLRNGSFLISYQLERAGSVQWFCGGFSQRHGIAFVIMLPRSTKTKNANFV